MDILAQECTELYSKRVYPWHFPDYRNVSRPRQMVGGASAAGEGGDEIEFVGECDFWQHK